MIFIDDIMPLSLNKPAIIYFDRSITEQFEEPWDVKKYYKKIKNHECSYIVELCSKDRTMYNTYRCFVYCAKDLGLKNNYTHDSDQIGDPDDPDDIPIKCDYIEDDFDFYQDGFKDSNNYIDGLLREFIDIITGYRLKEITFYVIGK